MGKPFFFVGSVVSGTRIRRLLMNVRNGVPLKRVVVLRSRSRQSTFQRNKGDTRLHFSVRSSFIPSLGG
jgi:hypothetical protein